MTPSAIPSCRGSIPAVDALAVAGFPALDLWIEATQYVERNACADYRIVQLEDGGRMLDVSGQAASRHDAEGKGWDFAERPERTLGEAGETHALVLGAVGMTLGKGAPCAYLRDVEARNFSQSTRQGYISLFRQLGIFVRGDEAGSLHAYPAR